jgi:hypothetical protein
MKHKTKTLGQIHDECTEENCPHKKDKTQCCAILVFGGSQFTDNDCPRRAKNTEGNKQ